MPDAQFNKMVKVQRAYKYLAGWEYVLTIDDKPVCIFKSQERASEAIKYLNGYEADINDGRVKKLLDKYRKGVDNVKL